MTTLSSTLATGDTGAHQAFFLLLLPPSVSLGNSNLAAVKARFVQRGPMEAKCHSTVSGATYQSNCVRMSMRFYTEVRSTIFTEGKSRITARSRVVRRRRLSPRPWAGSFQARSPPSMIFEDGFGLVAENMFCTKFRCNGRRWNRERLGIISWGICGTEG